jgi:hypothetical protein
VPLSINDFDNVYLKAKAAFDEWQAEYLKQMFEPVAIAALAQQVRQLPGPVQAELKRRAPQAWQRLFGGGV